jgi:hypothetical protein
VANIRKRDAQLADWETRYILLALSKEIVHLKAINVESKNEDKIADAGNNLLEISDFYEKLSSKAVSVFSEQILTFSDS